MAKEKEEKGPKGPEVAAAAPGPLGAPGEEEGGAGVGVTADGTVARVLPQGSVLAVVTPEGELTHDAPVYANEEKPTQDDDMSKNLLAVYTADFEGKLLDDKSGLKAVAYSSVMHADGLPLRGLKRKVVKSIADNGTVEYEDDQFTYYGQTEHISITRKLETTVFGLYYEGETVKSTLRPLDKCLFVHVVNSPSDQGYSRIGKQMPSDGNVILPIDIIHSMLKDGALIYTINDDAKTYYDPSTIGEDVNKEYKIDRLVLDYTQQKSDADIVTIEDPLLGKKSFSGKVSTFQAYMKHVEEQKKTNADTKKAALLADYKAQLAEMKTKIAAAKAMPNSKEKKIEVTKLNEAHRALNYAVGNFIKEYLMDADSEADAKALDTAVKENVDALKSVFTK